MSRLEGGYRYRPVWSPDSRKIAFHDSRGNLYLHTVNSGETKTIDRDPLVSQPQASWSPDSRWLAYARGAAGSPRFTAIWLYDSDTGRTHQVTSGAYNDSWPVFDSSGRYLYFVSARRFLTPRYDSRIGSSIRLVKISSPTPRPAAAARSRITPMGMRPSTAKPAATI